MIELNGKELSNRIRNSLVVPKNIKVVIIRVGNDESCGVYFRAKKKAFESVGIFVEDIHLEETATQEEVIQYIWDSNNDWSVTGIIVELPLPDQIDATAVCDEIRPDKDIDGLSTLNFGMLCAGREGFSSCTATAVMEILKEYEIPIEGKNCVVVGRSNAIGKQIAMNLLNANGTVTIAHSYTDSLEYICRDADILVVAVGKPFLINSRHIRKGSVVIDVGINRMLDGSICGDVDFDDVRDKVHAITPVPNGVGSMTITMLIKNLIKASKM